MEQLIQLYKAWRGAEPAETQLLPKAGSNRHYVRLTAADGTSVIGVVSADTDENRCFVYLSQHFGRRGLNVPQILATSADATCYLQTDLGTVSLYNALSHGRENNSQYDAGETSLIEATIRRLPHLQVEGAEGLDETRLLSPTVFDERSAMFDLNYFKYCFLRTTPVTYDEVRLDDDFRRLAADLVSGDDQLTDLDGHPMRTFLYRDFQARNVMLRTDGGNALPYFIDYQGGEMGPLQYDLVSFLWQASARYPQMLREAMITAYTDELRTLCRFDETAFRSRLHLFVLFRIMQVLGAYGLRGYFEHKQYFINSIPPAIQNLRRQLLDGVCASYPTLEATLRRLTELPQFEEKPAASAAPAPAIAPKPAAKEGPLVVRVFSFSYKRGIPTDESGNGGGYVFDCRSTNNPGRYAPYKKLTGLDEPVIRFLEDDGGILRFLESVDRLADHHVEAYMKRGFTDLMFSFGCTGGQHRSVYSAEHLARHLNQKYGIEVRLCHREQNISKTLHATNAIPQ